MDSVCLCRKWCLVCDMIDFRKTKTIQIIIAFVRITNRITNIIILFQAFNELYITNIMCLFLYRFYNILYC